MPLLVPDAHRYAPTTTTLCHITHAQCWEQVQEVKAPGPDELLLFTADLPESGSTSSPEAMRQLGQQVRLRGICCSRSHRRPVLLFLVMSVRSPASGHKVLELV